MSRSLLNKLYLRSKIFGFKMSEGTYLNQHINVFNQIVSNLKQVDMNFDDEDIMLMLLNSLPTSLMYENLVTIQMWG
jgi:hypothetical protein